MSVTPDKATWTRLAVLICLTVLVLVLTLDNFLFGPLSLSRWLVQIFPLLAFTPALHKQHIRAYQWLCFVILLYFIMGILNIFTPGKLITGSMITCCTVLIFSIAIAFIHQQQSMNSKSQADRVYEN